LGTIPTKSLVAAPRNNQYKYKILEKWNYSNPEEVKTMKSARIILATGLAVLLLNGCSTTGESNDLEAKVASAQTTADEAKAIATRAEQKADQALATANQALSASNGAQSTADQALKEAREAKALARDAAAQSERMFEKSMSK
jgi:uncharacterized lipoprotein YajG